MDETSFYERCAQKASDLDPSAPGPWYVRLRVGMGRSLSKETSRELPSPCTSDQARAAVSDALDTYLEDQTVYLELLHEKGTRSFGSCRIEPENVSSAAGPATRDDLMGAILQTNGLLSRRLETSDRMFLTTLEKLVEARIENAENNALMLVASDGDDRKVKAEVMREFLGGFKTLIDRQIKSPDDAIRQAEELVSGLRRAATPESGALTLSDIQRSRVAAIVQELLSMAAP